MTKSLLTHFETRGKRNPQHIEGPSHDANQSAERFQTAPFELR